MHLFLVPGLLLVVAVALTGVPAQPATDSLDDLRGAGSLFSIAAQATTTATLTTVTTEVTTDTTAAATSTVTSTSGIIATTTITGSVQSTPVPLPEPGGSIPLASNPFDPAFLFSPPPDEPQAPQIGPYGWGFLALMTALLLIAAYFMLVKRPEWKRTNPVLHRAANKWGQVALWVAIPGILLLLFRAVKLDFFNMRFWLYLWALATLAAAGWFVYWLLMKYPKEAAKYQKSQRARQYMPGSASKSAVRQTAQTKSKAVAAPAGDAIATTASTPTMSKPPSTQSKPGQKSNKRGRRK